ncbi:MAG TPA: hypothetical protein DEB31_03895 [Clostridiales bacterium]|nr:hypothetical protein [Clostridiales bacterium]
MTEYVNMRFPADTGYISAIRLAVSGIAGKMDYNLDEIEDLKSCVAESCLLLLCGQECDGLVLDIETGRPLKCRIGAQGAKPAPGTGECGEFNEEISRLMIEALSEHADFLEENGILKAISFEK